MNAKVVCFCVEVLVVALLLEDTFESWGGFAHTFDVNIRNKSLVCSLAADMGGRPHELCPSRRQE